MSVAPKVLNTRPESSQPLANGADVQRAIAHSHHNNGVRNALRHAAQQPVTQTKLALVYGAPLPAEEQGARTLPLLLRQVATEVLGDQIIYVQADGTEQRQSYAGLLEAAERVLAGLRQHGLQPQAKVILQLRHNQDILPSFWACLLGGFIPVMTAVPPTYREANSELERLKQVWLQLEQPLLVTDRATEMAMAELQRWLPMTAESIVTIEALRSHAPDPCHYSAQPEEVAFFSLTSGSTGIPKLIPLSHRNLLVRARSANHYCGHTRHTVLLNWLPLEHIGPISDLHLRAVILGCQQIFVPKAAVAGNPLNWLHLIDHYRATYSAAPNFAYALVNSSLEKVTGRVPASWDLSCVETLLCAGETVSPEVVQTFLHNLAPYGLRPTTLQPCFGMAEMGSGITYYQATVETPIRAVWVARASLAGEVVQLPPHAPGAVGLTSLGSIIPGLAMRIVDGENQVLPEATVGRFQVQGVAVSSGYYNNPTANHEVFLADGWFDTGDLGMIIAGELVLTGRAKESIIVNGANYANSEIEAVVEQLPGVEPSYTVACAVRMPDRQGEEIALFFCPQANHDPVLLAKQIQQNVAKTIGIRLDYVIPLRRADVPKTAIGKLQRIKLAKRLEAGEFATLIQAAQQTSQQAAPIVAPRTELERRLVGLWQEALQTEQVGIHDNFFGLGGASLNAARLITRLQEEFHDTFHVVAIFNAPTIAELATYLEAEYPSTLARVLGQPARPTVNGDRPQQPPLTAADVAEVRRRLPLLPPLRHLPTRKNPAAIIVLTAGRSGSTLLRVMLAGHPQLFAPPELVLMGYETLAERDTALRGESSIWREGVLKALTQLHDWSPSQAEAWLSTLAAQGGTVQELYHHLQQTLAAAPTPRILVEKTPQDTLNLEILRRAELLFDQPRYIHLTRHPYGAIHSFVEARLDQLMYALIPSLHGGTGHGETGAHKFSTTALGEAAWLISQQNILAFLQEVPAARQHRLQFETLVRQPRQTMEETCHFLGIDFAESMLQPYQEKSQRMTTGLHAESRMLGDVKFHQHKTIDATVADRWQSSEPETPLGDVTWAMAEVLGYTRPQVVASDRAVAQRTPSGNQAWLVRPQPNPTARLRLFCFHYAGGSAALFQRWPSHLPPAIEVCALQLPGRGNRLGEAPFTDLTRLTTTLVDVLQPELDRPFAFFGYSMGGLVAYEVARTLRQQDLPLPAHLLIAARRAPQFAQSQPHLSQLPDAQIVQSLRQAGNAIPQELGADQAILQLMLPTLRADFQLAETYRYAEELPLACPITVFGGIEDAHATAEQLAGWQQHTQQAFKMHQFAGGHFFLHSAQDALLAAINQALRSHP